MEQNALKRIYQSVDQFYNQTEIVKETALQVIKDFERYGIQIAFPSQMDFAYNALFLQLVPVIEELILYRDEQLKAMLYTIDVPEVVVHRAVQQFPEKSLGEVIADLILDREFKKVLTRFYFKGKIPDIIIPDGESLEE